MRLSDFAKDRYSQFGEDGILAESEKIGQANRYILEVAESIRDHRAAGHYTTQG